QGEDKVLVIYNDGSYELTNYELTNRFEFDKIMLIQRFDAKKVISAVYYDAASKTHFVKRFLIETTTEGKKFPFISEGKGSHLVVVSTDKNPQVEVQVLKGKDKETLLLDLD